jgi:porphobilinogen synthase
MTFPDERPRRLRRTPALRRLVAETRLHPADLVLPLFVKEGLDRPVPVSTMPGVVQHSADSLRRAVTEAAEVGLGGVMLFGIPQHKDATGSAADAENGVVQVALREVRREVGDSLVVMADLCLCEYTDHGHCGPVVESGDGSLTVDNDATLQRYAATAVAQASAGTDVVAPSGMMDGQVAAIRRALDGAGHHDVAILSYSAKYASAFYGPFREAAESTPAFGDRRGYQMNPANADEALREVLADLQQGADWVMVKPAGPYLDVVRRVADAVDVPVAAYQVSGEMAMVEAAAARGWIDRDRAIHESVLAVRRSGAHQVITYWAVEVARALSR